MRLLVQGMQSSGATAFAQVLAQRSGCLALVDVPNNYAAPRVTTRRDFVAKVVVTTAYPLAVHAERFRPDRLVLLLRDPRDNYASLRTKPYRHHSGLMDEKFRLLDQLFAERHRFDAIIHYEDLVARDPGVMADMAALGWPVEPGHFSFNRSYDELLGSLWAEEPHLQEEMEVVFGNARGRELSDRHRDKPRDAALEATVAGLCPRLLAHYRRRSSGSQRASSGGSGQASSP
ncbi:MAG: hypothetical protein ACOVN0_12550 [Niveispirillum sp.]|uniref:hypothetical protein n=1 Tax=Niveispirillum sp. TaxID=1917217 RepID=UPI003BA65418